MIFSDLEFFLFFALVFVVHWSLPRRPQRIFLLIVSYWFYMYWNWRFGALLFASSLLDWTLGRLISTAPSDRARRFYLVVTVTSNLGLLFVFKYFNFFADSFAVLMAQFGFATSKFFLDVILPAGISFYTFQSMSYTIDVYRKRCAPEPSFFNFALYVAFFPQLVAGPIVRAIDFLPLLRQTQKFSLRLASIGAKLFLLGYLKKAVIADNIAAAVVDPYFADPTLYGSVAAWLGVIAYSIQIYCDFSGYTDMARGSALLLGFKLPENFNMPYISRSITEFWHRWHISLSTWLKDYLYVPLGGNRLGRRRTYINLILTMLLGGLWHGAAWTFVFWGFYHGVLLAAHKWLMETRRTVRLPVVPGWLALPATYLLVLVGWVFFRATSFDQAGFILARMFWLFTPDHAFVTAGMLAAMLLMLGGHILGPLHGWYNRIYYRLPDVLRAAFWSLVIIGLAAFTATGYRPFIYFQF